MTTVTQPSDDVLNQTTSESMITTTEPNQNLKSSRGQQHEEERKLDQKRLELAMQVLKETRQTEGQEDDPYTEMAKKLEKQKKREFALRHATEGKRAIVEEEKKGGGPTGSR